MKASNNSLPEIVENAGVDTVVLVEDQSPETVASIATDPPADLATKKNRSVARKRAMRVISLLVHENNRPEILRAPHVNVRIE
jgi:hypothetical protein